MNDELNFNYNDFSKRTPNRNISISRFGTPLNYSNEPFPNSILNESNGVKLTNIVDESVLKTKFEAQENSIRSVCGYYISLKDIFKDADIEIKNKLLQYVTEFNNSCKTFLDKKTNNYIEAKKNSDEKNKLKENLNQKMEEFNNLEKKYRLEREELKENTKKEIQELKFKLKDAEDKIKKYKAKLEEYDNKLKEKENKIYSMREEFKIMEQPISQDYINISYCLGEQTEDININIDCPTKKDFDSFSSKFDKAENNFNIFANLLVDTSNKCLEKYKDIYKKIKGKEWIDANNSLIKVHYYQTYNINQDLSWINISNIHQTINAIINEIFELVNPTKNCDSKKLNEDSCEFLLNYIKGLKKLFFLQKEILDCEINIDCAGLGGGTQEKIKNFFNLKKIAKEVENFFEENNDILMNQPYFERFKEELNIDNTKKMMVDEYIKNIKTVFVQAKNIADKSENDFNDFKKNIKAVSKRTKMEDIEMELSNTKNKKINDNNN